MNLKAIFIGAALLIPLTVNAIRTSETIIPKTDQRVELMSIVFRLAGNDEYNMNQFKAYVADIDQWFGPYKNHPAILMAKRLRITRGVSYDAVMSMAIHINQPPALDPLIPFTSRHPDHRWGVRNGMQFLKLLRDFYQVSNFSQFYANHQPMYTIAENRMSVVLKKVNFDWFEQFYGVKSSGKFNLILGIGNGGGNYGPKVIYQDGSEDLYAIMGTWMIDKEGNPDYNDNILPTIIHEFNHSFANPLVDQNLQVLEKPGKALFKPVKSQMSKMAYGTWKTVMYESLVRATSVQYFKDNKSSPTQVKRLIISEMAYGFLWTDKLVALLGEYQNQRETYPTLSAFMPKVANFYAELAPVFDQVKADYEAHCAHVASIEPFANKANDVDPSITEIKIRFDKPLNPKLGYSINYGASGADHFAVTGKPKFSDDGQYLIVNVKLKPDWDYSFVLMPFSFRTMDDYPLISYEVKFRTRQQTPE